jgi:geranylgeranyl reductase family protein
MTGTLVIGAGPAGSAAALTLARAGVAVTLVDQHVFPRDKVCGDGLIPDALAALERLGLLEPVLRQACRAESVRVFAPNRRQVDVPGRIACLPRRVLDDILRTAAVEAGASFLAPLRLERLVEGEGRIRGAVFRTSGGEVELPAETTLLATGAAAAPLEIAGLCQRKAPSGMAVRAYYRHRALAEELRSLAIAYDASILPGYGWIFPGPDGVFNVGAGYFDDARRPPAGNVRRVFEAFVAAFPLAQRLTREGEPMSELKGAPLRTALKGARRARPGLLAIGEAIGTTYSFSGEGIGKALETGMLAAELVIDGLRRQRAPAALAEDYARTIESRFAARFAAYAAAQRWLSYPAICNFIAARARNGGFVRERLSGMLAETDDPRRLFSLRGFMRALVQPSAR